MITVPSILIVGGANLDITGSCFSRLIPGDSNPGSIKNSAGGVGRNIAEGLARLGLRSSLLTSLGKDIAGSLILENCHQVGIDTSAVFVEKDMSTGTYLAINNQLGALTAAISDMTIIDSLTPDLLMKRSSSFEDCDEIVLEANLPEESIHWICQQAKNKSVHADAVSATKAHRLSNVLSDIDTLKVNREEAAAILGLHGDDQFLAQSLFELGVKKVLLSKGPQGSTLFTREGTLDTPAIRGENKSDTGAGDSLLAGFIAARYLLKSPRDQLQFASACATSALASVESINPLLSKAMIKDQFMQNLGEDAWY